MKGLKEPLQNLSTNKLKHINMKKRISIIVIILAVFASIGFVLARNKKQINASNKLVDRSQIPVAVAVRRVGWQAADGSLRLPAVLEPSKQADISSTTAGKIISLRIALGSQVS